LKSGLKIGCCRIYFLPQNRYVALSDKIIEGSPQNSLSTVPVMPWGK
jgi:catabolite regulation protein CreA